jgi:hypothetical protein
VPQYFAALFHIGRVWKISSAALEEIRRLEEPGQFRRAVDTISERAPAERRWFSTAGPNRESVQAAVVAACDDAKTLHRQRLALAQRWWEFWRVEVEPLREQRMRLDAAYNEGFDGRRRGSSAFQRAVYDTVMLAVLPSRLFASLVADGIDLQADSSDSRQTYGRELLRLVTFSQPEETGYPPFWHRWLELQERQLHAEEQRLILPRVEAALEDLRARLQGSDPFARFDYGGEPASDVLAGLYREHTLPDGSQSPWLERWKGRTKTLPYDPKVRRDWQAILDELLRSADGEIKLGVCQTSQALNETWSDHVQREFEKRWITPIGRHVATSKDNEKAWPIDDFEALVRSVVERLKSIGYAVQIPSRQRFDSLFALVRKSEWYVDGKW